MGKRSQSDDILDGWPEEFQSLHCRYRCRARRLRWILTPALMLLLLLLIAAMIFVGYVVFDPDTVGKLANRDVEAIKPEFKPLEPQDLEDIQICNWRGLAVGRNGMVLVSEDRGTHWDVVGVETESSLSSVAFSEDCETGLVVGNKGTIMRYVNDELRSSESHTEDNFEGVAIGADGRRAVAVGLNGTVRTSGNGGQEWADSGNIVGEHLNAVAVSRDESVVAVVGDERVVAYSLESGDRGTWERADAQRGRERSDFADVAFAGNERGVAVGDDGLISIFSKGTWSEPSGPQVKELKANFEAVAISEDGTRAIAVGKRGQAWISIGGALTDWSKTETLVGQDLNDVAVSEDGRSAIAVGDSGRILVFSLLDGTWCAADSRTGRRLRAVDFTGQGDTAVAVGDAGDRATVLKIDARRCDDNVTRLEVEMPLVEVGREASQRGDQEVDPDLEFAVLYLVVTVVRVAAVLVFLIMVWQLISLIRYHLRLAAFYEGRGDAILMTNPKALPQSDDIESFERLAKAATPEDVDFERTPRGLVGDALRVARTIIRRK